MRCFMFGKISKLALGMSLIGGVMESQAIEILDLAQMIKNTTEQKDLSQSIIEEISPQYPAQQNEEVLIQASNNGNCVAQYKLAECYSEMAMEQYGSEKFETKRNGKKLNMLMLSVTLHNIPEGITTFLTTTSNLKLGITLSLAIALHNIPEGIAIAIPIFYATKNRSKAFLYTVISGFSEFFGAIFAFLFLKEYLNFFLLSCLFGITAGIMIHISLTELQIGRAHV